MLSSRRCGKVPQLPGSRNTHWHALALWHILAWPSSLAVSVSLLPCSCPPSKRGLASLHHLLHPKPPCQWMLLRWVSHGMLPWENMVRVLQLRVLPAGREHGVCPWRENMTRPCRTRPAPLLFRAVGSRCMSQQGPGLEQIPGCRERWMAGISRQLLGMGMGGGEDFAEWRCDKDRGCKGLGRQGDRTP